MQVQQDVKVRVAVESERLTGVTMVTMAGQLVDCCCSLEATTMAMAIAAAGYYCSSLQEEALESMGRFGWLDHSYLFEFNLNL